MWQGTNDTEEPTADPRRDRIEARIEEYREWAEDTDGYARRNIEQLISLYERGWYDFQE